MLRVHLISGTQFTLAQDLLVSPPPQRIQGLWATKPSSRTVGPGSTQPLTDMSTRKLPGSKGRPELKADSLTDVCEPIVCNSGIQPFFFVLVPPDVNFSSTFYPPKLLKLKLICDRQTVGQGTHLGPVTDFSISLKFPLDSCVFVIL
jgi:hypothetical protein